MSRRHRVSRGLLVLALGSALAPGALAGGDPIPPDAVDEALASVGVTRRDVGWRPRGWWDRYPMDIPHKLRHVDDLMAQPFAVVPYVRTMGTTARTLLAPDAKPGELGAGALFRAVHDLGVQHRRGATRPYSANLSDAPERLVPALLDAHRAGGRSPFPMTFGKAPDFPRLEKDLEAATEALPPEVDAAIGRLVADLVEARTWIDLAWRRVPLETRIRVAARLDLNVEMTDATDYEPAIDDLAKDWDEASLWYGALKTVEAVDRARKALREALAAGAGAAPVLRFEHETPLGRVVILGTGDDAFDVGTEGALLVVDLGGNDKHTGRMAASSGTRPLGVLLDLGGNDVYESDAAAQGAGVVGVGVLLDVDGNDTYRVRGSMGQGVGQCGLGALLDLDGDDHYGVGYSGQGCGYLGIGTLLDLAGNDVYTLWCDGQGFGGAGGVGVLADGAGSDAYTAIPDPEVTKRPSGHSDGKVSCSNAQGCGMGRRGDGSDGHSWAGGLGALLDVEGRDSYACGNWGQGVGYWFGTGFLWDGAGNDEYLANGWASGSGAHFCIGAVVDEAGDDVHYVKQNWGPAFGHDFTVGVLYDGGGSDRYGCGGGGIANAINRSVALLLEAGGDDHYEFWDEKHRLPGLAKHDPKYLDRAGTSLYWSEATSLALFLDLGGKDEYPDPDSSAPWENDASRADAPGSEGRRARNWSVAVDRAAGVIDLDRPSD